MSQPYYTTIKIPYLEELTTNHSGSNVSKAWVISVSRHTAVNLLLFPTEQLVCGSVAYSSFLRGAVNNRRFTTHPQPHTGSLATPQSTHNPWRIKLPSC